MFAYIAGAAEDNLTLADNRQALGEYGLIPRVLRSVGDRNSEVELFGRRYAAPCGIAPLGLAALMAYRGDLALARAAVRARAPMILSGASLIRLEEVAETSPDVWFQMYVPGEPARISALIERVRRARIKTLVVTVDVCVAANRENLLRAGFETPLRPSLRLAWEGASHPRWLFGTFLRTLVDVGMPHFENGLAVRGAPLISRKAERDFGAREDLNWQHLKLIRRLWTGPLVLKGVLHADDVRLAREAGVDAVIISSHGGRQLDGAIGSLRALPSALEAAGEMPLMIDSGFRRGSDVLKAVALGARMVFVGRPMLYAAVVAGEAGVARALALLRAEIERDMALLGVRRLAELTPDHVRHRVVGPATA